MDHRNLERRWTAAIAALTAAIPYNGPLPDDPSFALEFSSLARVARRSCVGASRALVLHGLPGAGTSAMAKRLGFPPAAPGAEVFDVFILPRSFEALCRRIDGTPLFAQRLTASVEFLERTAAAARPNVSPIFLVNDDEERLMAIVAYLLEGRDAEIGYAVTTDGRPTHGVTKAYAHGRDIRDAIAVVYVCGTHGRLLLQQRGNDKTWDHSAAGHLAVGETPADGAARELWEELQGEGALRLLGAGIADHPPGFPPRRHWFHGYAYTCDGPFVCNPEEVLDVRWTTLQQLERDLVRDPQRYAGGLHATYPWFKEQIESNT